MTALTLLRPRALALRNGARRSGSAERRRAAVLGLLAAAFWAAIFVFFARVLAYFQSVPELGPVLAERLLGMVLLTFFSVLLFSNVITSLSTCYLSADLALLVASPAPRARLQAARFLETLWDSSWTVFLFGLPVFLAFGVVYRTGPLFYLAVLVAVGCLVVLAAAVGVSLTTVIVRFFPARNTRDVLLLLSVVAGAVLLILLRSLQPERLVRPEVFANFLDFLAAVQAPASPYLPSAWAAAVLLSFLSPRAIGDAVVQGAALLTTTAAARIACAAIAERWHEAGWWRAQEGRRAGWSRLRVWDALVDRLPVSRPVRALVAKDAKTFFRDTAQWSQLLLLGALVVVYVYNFRLLPRAQALLAQAILAQALAFVNLALAGFVVASIGVRFLYPSISLEGKAFWVLQTAPIRLSALWWSKFWSGLLPLGLLGVLLIVLSNRALEVDRFTMAMTVATLVLMTVDIAALGLCFGAYYPHFDYENAAKIPTSFGGAVYMIVSILFIGANVVLEAWPVYRMLFAKLAGRQLSGEDWAGVVTSFAAVLALDAAVFIVATRLGIRKLESL